MFNFSATTKSYAYTPKDDPKDRVEVEIGDSQDSSQFFPQVKIKRWDNECNLSYRLNYANIPGNISYSDDGNTITWKKGQYEAHFYHVNDEEGAFEFDITIPKKPPINYLEFTLNTKDVEYFYQPALKNENPDGSTWEEDEYGRDERPANVVGSYEVYAATPKTNYVGGKEYKCGKVGHIYRPQIFDANNNTTWGELNITNGILRVTIPQDFLDTAVYPVRHAAGLSFGYATNGASTYTSWADEVQGTKGIPASSGTVQSTTVYMNSANDSFKGVLVASDAIVTNGIGAAKSGNTPANWYTSNFSVNPSVTASSTYYACVVCNVGSGNIYYTAGSTNDGIEDPVNSYASPSSPLSSYKSYNTRKLSIYVTYTPSGTFPVRESVTETDFATSVTSMAVNMPATVNAGDRLIALCHARNAGTWTTVPADWSNLVEQAGGGAVGELSIFEKIAVGNEDGGTATWVTGTGTTAAWQVIRISGAHASTASEVTPASGDSSAANPPSETASWGGNENNLWLAVAGHSAASAAAFSASPPGFLGFAQNGASSGGAAVCVAHGYDLYAGDTYDPGTFTVSGSNRWWAAATIVVRPAATGGGGGNAKLINIGNTWKSVNGMQINIGNVWKPVVSVMVNIGNVWKSIF